MEKDKFVKAQEDVGESIVQRHSIVGRAGTPLHEMPLENHILLPCKYKHQPQCYLCKVVDNSIQQKTGFCCSKCQVGFHMQCFAAYHHCDALQHDHPVLAQVADESLQAYTREFKKPKSMSSMKDLKLPCI